MVFRKYGMWFAMLWMVGLYAASSSACTSDAPGDSASQASEQSDLDAPPVRPATCGICPLVHQQIAAGLAVDPRCAISCIDCGDHICNNGETNEDCPVDCPLNPPPSGPVCGNGRCETGENHTSCPADCGPPVCGNGKCEPGESINNCREDCCRLQHPPCSV
jgi:hypothetical protein